MVSAIIVSAGEGLRMGEATRKQYLQLKGRPILSHTLLVFDSCAAVEQVILVIPADDIEFCRQEIVAGLNKTVRLVAGGMTRQESVYNGLQAVTDEDGVVMIHDGVRPFVRLDQIEKSLEVATRCGACILALPAHDTLKQVDNHTRVVATLERKGVWYAQTPQTFRFALIKKAHEYAARKGFTASDDAALVERMGEAVQVINGSKYNIKITTKEDLSLARAILGSEIK